MCDEDSLTLQNIMQSVLRREVKIILQRAEYIFPALKDSLVRVLVCVHARAHTHTKTCKCVFPENYFWAHFATKLIFLHICQLNCLKFFSGIYLVLSILHSCCIGRNKYIVEKCIYSVYTGNIYTTGLYGH